MDVLAVNGVWVSSESGLVTSLLLELNESAVLLTVDVEVDELTEGGESSLERVGVHVLSDVADVAHGTFILDWLGDRLWAVLALTLGVSAGGLPAL
jgi:hypothetical protein